jgi:hypothetical protein
VPQSIEHGLSDATPSILADLEALTKGASKDLGIPAQTVQEACDEHIDRRRGSKKAKLRWRGKRSLGWVPFKNQTIVLDGDVVRFNGRKVRLWKHRDISGRISTQICSDCRVVGGP